MGAVRMMYGLVAVAALLHVSAGWAQTYPARVVSLVPSQPGGALDFTSRTVAPGLTAALGQQVIVDNRAGLVIGGLVAKAAPDGHTLLVQSNALWILALMQKTPYHPVRDFAPVTAMTRQFNILVVHPSFPAKSVKELIAVAKARAGDVDYASAATGTTSHISAEIFKSLAGVNLVRIPYKGGGQAINDLLAGEVPVMFGPVAPIVPHVRSGRLRALGITSAAPSELVPGVPTIAAAGVPGYESVSMYGLFAPAKTPTAIVSRLHREVVVVLKQPEIRERFFRSGMETVGSTPEELAAFIQSDMQRVSDVVKMTGAAP